MDAAVLMKEASFVAGHWVHDGRGTTVVTNPADNTVLGTVPRLTADCAGQAVQAAANSWCAWRKLRAVERADVLCRWGELIRRHRQGLALLITMEQGKPLAEALGEVDYARSFVRWFADESQRQYGETIPTHISGSRLFVKKEPVGVVAAITPWNFPCAMVTRKASAAMAAGCPVIVVPSPETPFSALALAHLAETAGVPAGVISVLTGDPSELVPALCGDPDVRAVSFTGSTEIGRLIMRLSSETVKKVSLELGGHAPFIVFDDADIGEAVAGCLEAKFATGGQDCLGANRIYVHQGIYDEFESRLVDAVRKLRVGPGIEPGVDIGPLIHERAVRKCDAHVDDAVARGARIVVDGGVRDDSTLFYHPVVLREIDRSMDIYREETFGPVAPLIRFDDEQNIVAMANDSIYGLAAYVYSADASRAWDVADVLEYGLVALNTAKMTGAPVPFGGYKQSGLGREGSHYGLDEFSETKFCCWGGT